MANAVDPAGDNGVAGTNYAVSGIGADFAAKRESVAKTQKGFGNAVTASGVFSLTQNLRFAYANGQEADSPVEPLRTTS